VGGYLKIIFGDSGVIDDLKVEYRWDFYAIFKNDLTSVSGD
jgi:hypothetical protein